jgi:hypothetical protein
LGGCSPLGIMSSEIADLIQRGAMGVVQELCHEKEPLE